MIQIRGNNLSRIGARAVGNWRRKRPISITQQNLNVVASFFCDSKIELAIAVKVPGHRIPRLIEAPNGRGWLERSIPIAQQNLD